MDTPPDNLRFLQDQAWKHLLTTGASDL